MPTFKGRTVYYTVQQIPGFVVTADAMKEALTAEIVEMTDRVTVLRDGGVVGAGVPTREVDEASLTRTMLGRHLVVQSRVGTHARDEVVASARGMSVGTVTGLDVAARPPPPPSPQTATRVRGFAARYTVVGVWLAMIAIYTVAEPNLFFRAPTF